MTPGPWNRSCSITNETDNPKSSAMSSTDKYFFLLRMKPFLSLFLWNLTSIFYSVETLHKILCRNFSSKRQISLFFQLLIQIANDLISRCLFYLQKFLNNPVPVSLLSGDRGSSAIIRYYCYIPCTSTLLQATACHIFHTLYVLSFLICY